MACAAICLFTACSSGNSNIDTPPESANTGTPPVTEKVDTSLEVEIVAEFAKKYNLNTNEVSLVKCDVQDGVYAVYACGYDTALSYETVGPITYIFPNTPHYMEIYRYGSFHSLSTAYDRGLLYNDSLLNIARKRGEGWYRLDEEKWADIKSSENEIKSAYAAKYNVPVDTVYLSGYGEYNGAHAVMIFSHEFGANTAETYDALGGVILTYPTTQKMEVYYKGEFCSLPEAYENGLLTNSDLTEIAKKYGGQYLGEQKEAEIIAAYRTANAVGNGDEVVISAYYGEVNEYEAISVGVKGTAPYLDKVEEIKSDGELFGKERHSVDKVVFKNNFGISLYKDGGVYTLKYAVENKLISVEEFFHLSGHHSFGFVD